MASTTINSDIYAGSQPSFVQVVPTKRVNSSTTLYFTAQTYENTPTLTPTESPQIPQANLTTLPSTSPSMQSTPSSTLNPTIFPTLSPTQQPTPSPTYPPVKVDPYYGWIPYAIIAAIVVIVGAVASFLMLKRNQKAKKQN